jgi:hypothetical protein
MLPILTSAAVASTFVQVPDLAELAERSSAVITGEVTATAVAPAPWGLSTRYEVAVDEVLAGRAADAVVVELPGGKRDGLTQRFSGVPVLSPGDRVAVFVPRAGDPQPLSGVFTLSGEDVVDPLARDAAPRSVSDLVSQIRRAGEGEGDPARNRYFEAGGTPDPE